MASLVQDACTLRFEEYEFIEFFGVAPPLDEEACAYEYELKRDGLRLVFTLFPLDGRAFTRIFRDGIAEPIATSRLRNCTHYRIVDRYSTRCLEIGRPERPTTEASAPLVWGLRLVVNPHFRFEHIHELA